VNEAIHDVQSKHVLNWRVVERQQLADLGDSVDLQRYVFSSNVFGQERKSISHCF
jgi:hypothetical protein